MVVQIMDEYRAARRVLMAEDSGLLVRVWSRPRLRWMDRVKAAFGQQRNDDDGGCSTMRER